MSKEEISIINIIYDINEVDEEYQYIIKNLHRYKNGCALIKINQKTLIC